VLQEGANPPSTDSVRIPGSLLVLRRGEPTRIVVHNQLRRHLSVHWHGIELESYSDGVAGWSGSVGNIAPPIAPGDSFVARMTPPRAGTFIYHVHNEGGEELPSGLYGALLVLEPGEIPDPDRVIVISEPGPSSHEIGGKRPFVNGTTDPPAQELVVGRTYRFRVITISANTGYGVQLMNGATVLPWKLVARDGADLPRAQVGTGPGDRATLSGTTRDYEVTPTEPGTLTLSIDAFRQNGTPLQQPVLVTFRVRPP
jgi:FtsP/CotA-like multicopper oxidase with cupredoxin domain